MVERQDDTDNLLELGEAAKQLNIGIATLFRRMRAGDIFPVRKYRRTFIPESEIERLNKKATTTES